MAYCRVVVKPGFYRTQANLREGQQGEGIGDTVVRGDLLESLEVPKGQVFVIVGDCRGEVRLNESAGLHILGDLGARVTIEGDGEMVVGGDVGVGGTILSNRIGIVMIGGDLQGEVISTGMLQLWVLGSMSGSVQTGTPSTTVHVMGDMSGRLKPFQKPSPLTLDVHGYMSEAALNAILENPYTEVSASIGYSDIPVGIHFGGRIGALGEPVGEWVVHRQRSTGQ